MTKDLMAIARQTGMIEGSLVLLHNMAKAQNIDDNTQAVFFRAYDALESIMISVGEIIDKLPENGNEAQ